MEAQLLHAFLLHQAVGMLPQLRARELSNMLWAAARLGPHPGPDWVNAFIDRAQQLMPSFNAQDMGNTMWALARFRCYPGPTFMSAFLQHSHSALPRMDAQALVNVAWALATLDYRPHASWAQTWQSALLQQLQSLTPQGHANALWAAVHLGSAPAPHWLACISHMLLTDPAQFQPQELSMLLLALAKADAGQVVGHGSVAAAADAGLAQLRCLSITHAAWMVWGLAHLRYRPCGSQMAALYAHTQPLLAQADAKTLPNLVLALAKLHRLPPTPPPQQLLGVHAPQHAVHQLQHDQPHTQQQVPDRTSTQGPPPAWVDSLLAATEPLLPGMAPHSSAMLVYSLSQLGVTPPPAWVSALLSATRRQLQPGSAPTPACLMCAAVALARWRAQPGAAYLSALAQCVAATLPQATPKEAANTLLALAHVRTDASTLQPLADALQRQWLGGRLVVRGADVQQVLRAAAVCQGLDVSWVQRLGAR